MLNFRKYLPGTLAVLAALVLMIGLLAAPTPSRSDDWKQVTIVYTGDINGKIEPCG